MSNRAKITDHNRSVIAGRLKEVIADKGVSQSDLIRKTKLRYGLAMTSAQMSMIVNGKRSLPNDYAVKFAEILEIDPGYLLGADDLRSNSYSEYLESVNRQDLTTKEFKEFWKYFYLIEPLGFKIVDMTIWNDEISDFSISQKGKIATIPADEMKRFLSDVQKYMKKRIAPLMDLYREEA